MFCPLGLDEGSGVLNESKILSPAPAEPECQPASHTLDANTLFFVLNNDVLPDYEHNLTYTVSNGA